MIELLNLDCMDYMKDCEDNAFDLAIVDPPYGLSISKQALGVGGGKYREEKKKYKMGGDWDDAPPTESYLKELKRISKNQIIWGANHFLGWVSPCWIIWDKNNGGSDFADAEIAWTSFSSPIRMFKYTWNGFCQEMMGRAKEYRIHPTQKPVALYEWLLHKFAKPGQRIIDTHLGSGSSAIAVHYFGCDFVGMEIDKDYYDAACQRFNDETKQLDLLA